MTKLDEAIDEMTFWRNKAAQLGLEVYGWTYKTRAVFIIPKTQSQIHLSVEDWDALIEGLQQLPR